MSTKGFDLDTYSKKLYIDIKTANTKDILRKYFTLSLLLLHIKFHIKKGKIK